MAPRSSSDEWSERRPLIVAAAVFFGALIALIGVATLLNRDAGDESTSPIATVACAPDDDACLAQQARERPGIIPKPGSGQEPTEAGQPGGAAQIALLGGIVGALVLIVGLVVRSSRRNRDRRTPDPDRPATRAAS